MVGGREVGVDLVVERAEAHDLKRVGESRLDLFAPRYVRLIGPPPELRLNQRRMGVYVRLIDRPLLLAKERVAAFDGLVVLADETREARLDEGRKRFCGSPLIQANVIAWSTSVRASAYPSNREYDGAR